MGRNGPVPVEGTGPFFAWREIVPPARCPWPFYERFGFVPTGELDPDGEVILRFDLTD